MTIFLSNSLNSPLHTHPKPPPPPPPSFPAVAFSSIPYEA